MEEMTKDYRMNYDVKFTHETASLLAILNSVTDDRFPTLFASEDERINKIVLNEIQRSIPVSYTHLTLPTILLV